MRKIKITEEQAKVLKGLNIINEDEYESPLKMNQTLRPSNQVDRNFKKYGSDMNEGLSLEIVQIAEQVVEFLKLLLTDPSQDGLDKFWISLGMTRGEMFGLLADYGLMPYIGMKGYQKISKKEFVKKAKGFLKGILKLKQEKGEKVHKENVNVGDNIKLVEDNSTEIRGVQILNHPPYNTLPSTREEANKISGLGVPHIPSISEPDAMSKVYSKDELTGFSYKHPTKGHVVKIAGYLASFQNKFGEEPIFVLDPSEVWYNKVKIINPNFVKWRQEQGDIKSAGAQPIGGLGKEDVDETTTAAGSSGAFVGKLGQGTPINRPHSPQEELGETTTTTSAGGESGTFALSPPLGDGSDFWNTGNKQNKKITKVQLESNAKTDTQWPKGVFVEPPVCSKLDNNKEAQNGGCNQGTMPKMRTTKNSVISDEEIYNEVAKKTGRSVNEVFKLIKRCKEMKNIKGDRF